MSPAQPPPGTPPESALAAVLRRLTPYVALLAAGVLALNVTGYLDMLVRGRPESARREEA